MRRRYAYQGRYRTKCCCCVLKTRYKNPIKGLLCMCYEHIGRCFVKYAPNYEEAYDDCVNYDCDYGEDLFITPNREVMPSIGSMYLSGRVHVNEKEMRVVLGGESMFRKGYRPRSGGIHINDVVQYCVTKGKPGTIEACVKNGFDVNAICSDGDVALSEALGCGIQWAVAELCQFGANSDLVGFSDPSMQLNCIEKDFGWAVRKTLALRGAELWKCGSTARSQAEHQLIAIHKRRVQRALDFCASLNFPPVIQHLIVEFESGPCSQCLKITS